MSSTSLEIADWLDATYEALAEHDIGLFLSSFAPDARWTLQGHSVGLRYAGTHIGRDAIARLVSGIVSDFRPRDFFVEDIIVGEGTAAVRWSVMLHALQTGRMRHLEVFDHVVFRDGAIRSLTQFFDSGAVAATAGLLEPAPAGETVRHFLRQTNRSLKR
ncbi:MAG: nuclear transport factor 2 family protein [Hyphomonas sp.]|nr:nuclear transport factor 2 family protein [Hyphomonas sp.]